MSESVETGSMYQSEYDIQTSKLMIGRYSTTGRPTKIQRLDLSCLGVAVDTFDTKKSDVWTAVDRRLIGCEDMHIIHSIYIFIYIFATNKTILQNKSYIIIHHTQHIILIYEVFIRSTKRVPSPRQLCYGMFTTYESYTPPVLVLQ